MKIALLAVLLLIFPMSLTCLADNATELFYKGGDALKQQKYDLAIDYFNKAIQISNNYAKAYCARGLAYQGKMEYDKSIADLSESIRLKPDDAAFVFRGNAYVEIKNYGRQWQITMKPFTSIQQTGALTFIEVTYTV